MNKNAFWKISRTTLRLATALLMTSTAHAEFQNGSFEQDWTGWTVSPLRVANSIPVFPPTKFEDLGTVPWVAADPAVSVVVGSTVAPNTGGALTTPLFGNKSARVGDGRTQYRGAQIRQTATMNVGDIDPADGKVHVRFAVAPVLNAPSHPGNQQPYVFVEVKNITKGTQLFYTFNFANQTGVAWQAVGSYQFTNWQALDVSPGAGVLDVGDQVEVIIVSGGCGQSGHGGLVYVDSGQGLTTLPGPFVTATAPEYVVRSDAGADTPATPPATPPAGQRTVTYNYHYSNGGDAPMPSSQVVLRSPQDQDLRNARGGVVSRQQNLRVDPGSLPAGCSITQTINEPHADQSLGPIDVVTCNVGTLNPGNVGDIQLRWIVPDDARGPTLNHGNYYIQSASSPPLLGPLVKSTLTTLQRADLKVAVTNPASSQTCGSGTTYTVTLDNDGPNTAPAGVTIGNTVPSGLTVGGWTCRATGALACPAPTGSGSIAGTTTTPWAPGEQMVYTVAATLDSCSGSARSIVYPVSVNLPAADATIVDPETSNNNGAHSLSAGPAFQPLTVNTSGNGIGKVTSVLPGIVCDKTATGTQCSDSKQFPTGSQVALYANAPAGSIFAGWSGGVCAGTAQPCLVTMDQSRSVTATFAIPLNVSVTAGAGGTMTPPGGTTVPVASGGTTSINVVPNAGFAPVFGGTCPAGRYVGNTYTTGAVTANCTVDVTFTNAAGVVTVTPNAPSGGSIIGGPKTVTSGGSATWRVVPNSGFAAANPTHTCSPGVGSWNTDRTEYTISPISADCSVTFAFVPSVAVTGSVSATSPGPGSLTAGATQSVPSGGSAVFTLSRAGTVDPASTCTGGSFDATNTTYTVPNVTATCAMVFSFAAVAAPQSIPTLSEWGLVIMSALMALGMVIMRRRQML